MPSLTLSSCNPTPVQSRTRTPACPERGGTDRKQRNVVDEFGGDVEQEQRPEKRELAGRVSNSEDVLAHALDMRQIGTVVRAEDLKEPARGCVLPRSWLGWVRTQRPRGRPTCGGSGSSACAAPGGGSRSGSNVGRLFCTTAGRGTLAALFAARSCTSQARLRTPCSVHREQGVAWGLPAWHARPECSPPGHDNVARTCARPSIGSLDFDFRAPPTNKTYGVCFVFCWGEPPETRKPTQNHGELLCRDFDPGWRLR